VVQKRWNCGSSRSLDAKDALCVHKAPKLPRLGLHPLTSSRVTLNLSSRIVWHATPTRPFLQLRSARCYAIGTPLVSSVQRSSVHAVQFVGVCFRKPLTVSFTLFCIIVCRVFSIAVRRYQGMADTIDLRSQSIWPLLARMLVLGCAPSEREV
jgi:hypothetical protein